MQFKENMWFIDEVDKAEHIQRISNVLNIKQYLLRVHPVLQRKDFTFKSEVYITAKTVLNILKSIINFHTSYVVGNPISINGEQEIVKKYNQIYKKGLYTKIDYEIVGNLYKYGNSFEYIYLENNVIKSKVIENEDSYPVYDDDFNYVAFVEHWQNFDTSDTNDIIYTPEKVEIYKSGHKIKEYVNLSGLPIHYCMIDKSEYNHFGDSIMNDLIPIVNQIESLLAKLDDAITTLSLNPLGVSSGQRLKESIPKDIVGATLNLEDGGSFQFVNAMMDYNNIKHLLDSLTQNLYAVAGVPASVIGQSNIANVSEVSLKLLFSQTDNRAKQTIQVVKEGLFKRFEYFNKLLALQGMGFNEDLYDSLDVAFNVNRPVDTNSLMNELKTQYDMGAISKQTIIDISPYSVDTALELQRIAGETNSASGKDKEEKSENIVTNKV